MKKNIANIILIIFSVILLSCCSSGDKKEGEDVKKTEENTHNIQPPPLNLAPGTASISAEIISVDLKSIPKKCEVKILKVNAYGSSTPVIASNSNIEITLPDNILKESEKDNLKAGKKCSFQIRSIEKMGSESVSNWICVKIK
jgi:PBP1b-binding outer membrane lipoprotein LpoB